MARSGKIRSANAKRVARHEKKKRKQLGKKVYLATKAKKMRDYRLRKRLQQQQHKEEELKNSVSRRTRGEIKRQIEQSLLLMLTGPGSIFELMFTRSDGFGLPVPLFAKIADDMIAYRINQSDTERVGGKVTNILCPERSLLKDDMVDTFTFLSQNLTPIHTIDTDRLVKEWIKRGHKLPYNANEKVGTVLRRFNCDENTHPFLKKRWK